MADEREIVTELIGTGDASVDPVPPRREPAWRTTEEVDTIAVAVRGRLNRIRQEMVAVGRDLLRAKNLLPRGQWIPWLKAEFEMSVRTAENYMNVADRIGDQFASLANLRLETAYRLAARSTPDTVIEAVLARALSEEGLSDSDAAAMLPKADRAPAAKPASSEVSPCHLPPVETSVPATVPDHDDPPQKRREPLHDDDGASASASANSVEPVSPPLHNRSRQQVENATRKAFEQLKNLKTERLKLLCPVLRECDPSQLAMMLEKVLAVKAEAST